eukprot:1161453-Pelagomonas_calceolata.AAC.3
MAESMRNSRYSLLGSSVVWIMLLWGQAQCAWSERPAGGLGIAALLCMLALRPLLLLLLLLMMMGGGGRVPAAAMEAGCCWWSGERAGVAGVRWPIFPWPSMRAALSASTGRKLLAVLTGAGGSAAAAAAAAASVMAAVAAAGAGAAGAANGHERGAGA